jgi:hypothetical protein
MKKLLLLFVVLIAGASFCQEYSIAWHKVAGGGGTRSGGSYQVGGTIGQADASGAMSGGVYSLTGGFWSFISVVQTAGLPSLTITRSGNSIIVTWPNTANYTLQQNSNLAESASWMASGYSISSNANGTNSITITPPTGNLFFRLANP